jgi:hypothetical protein
LEIPPAHSKERDLLFDGEPRTLSDLQRLQADAITALDFTLARELQAEIDSLATANTDGQVSDLREGLAEKLNALDSVFRAARRHLKNSMHQAEIAERQRLDTAFEDARSRHFSDLSELQERLLGEYMTEMAKPMTEYNRLLGQARANALHADFARAQHHQERADAVKAAETARRKEAYDRNYKAAVIACVKRQQAEIAALAAQGRVTLATFETERTKRLDDQLAKFRKDLARAYKDAVSAVTSPSMRREPVDRKFVADCLNGLEDAYQEALVRFGLTAAENVRRPRMLAPGSRVESRLSIRMQSRIENRVDPRRAVQRDTSRSRPPARRTARTVE